MYQQSYFIDHFEFLGATMAHTEIVQSIKVLAKEIVLEDHLLHQALSLKMNHTLNMSVIIATKIKWSLLKIRRFVKYNLK